VESLAYDENGNRNVRQHLSGGRIDRTKSTHALLFKPKETQRRAAGAAIARGYFECEVENDS
jgi:hypothetical protein